MLENLRLVDWEKEFESAEHSCILLEFAAQDYSIVPKQLEEMAVGSKDAWLGLEEALFGETPSDFDGKLYELVLPFLWEIVLQEEAAASSNALSLIAQGCENIYWMKSNNEGPSQSENGIEDYPNRLLGDNPDAAFKQLTNLLKHEPEMKKREAAIYILTGTRAFAAQKLSLFQSLLGKGTTQMDELLLKSLGQKTLASTTRTQATSPYELALERITAAEANGQSSLDLKGMGLTELPPEIGKLSHLTQLNLNRNQLRILPAEIGQLSNLQGLMMGENLLTSLPAEIAHLSSLMSLNLMRNQLEFLPPEIGKLSNLQALILSRNRLSSLAPEIGNLRNLSQLELDGNKFSQLPAEIGNLAMLKSLKLTGNSLSSLPPEIGNLSRLESLDLSNNQLISLPDQIGKLSLLQYLNLYSNPLSALPAEIGNLANLQGFDLSQNRLTSLPPEIGNLSQLQRLSLSSNRLTSLPAEIRNLKKLRYLNIAFNQFQNLLHELRLLKEMISEGGEVAGLSPNLFTNLPQAVQEGGIKAILDYLLKEDS
jgi:Leucine-rich repeat (LRR) protein